jgi:membrane associated rhomboid family serine protease
MQKLQLLLNTPTVGASGAIFGVLLAFGVLFPNTQLMLLFPPIPLKAKYFVLIYGIIELSLAVTQPGSNIAHAAHLGGMLFGYLLIRYWRKTTNTLY